jgi:urease accessory protein
MATDPRGWTAHLSLGFEVRDERTRLIRRSHCGPLTVQRPFYPEGGVCHLYLLHPPGGLVGGDQLHLDAELATGSHALITTPGAAKFYRTSGATAIQRQSLRVCDGAILEWLPQENILFAGAAANLATEVYLEPRARFLGWEIHCLGRPAVGERFSHGRADLQLTLVRNGPLLRERLRVSGKRALDARVGLRGYPVTGTFLASQAGQEDLDRTRACLPGRSLAAATLVDGVLIARCLHSSTERIREIFTRLWAVLRPALLGRTTCPPRIWAT